MHFTGAASISDVIQTVTLLIAVIGILAQFAKSNEDRENGTYDSLDARFTRFLEICSKYPELEVYNPLRDNWKELTGEQYRRQLILYQMLVSIFERAYILYNENHLRKSSSRRHQWAGWFDYMKHYAGNPTFLYAWDVEGIGEGMDSAFLGFMQDEIKIGKYAP